MEEASDEAGGVDDAPFLAVPANQKVCGGRSGDCLAPNSESTLRIDGPGEVEEEGVVVGADVGADGAGEDGEFGGVEGVVELDPEGREGGGPGGAD